MTESLLYGNGNKMEFIKSEKGKNKLLIEGYLFIKDKVIENKVYWKCEVSKKLKCSARVITIDDNATKINNVHNHIGDAASVGAARVYNTIKENAKSTRDTPQFIISTASENVGQAVAARLPAVSSIKKTIRNIRASENLGPAVPNRRQDIQFPPEFTITANGEDLLLYDKGQVEDRIIIFSTRRNLRLLESSAHWYTDGTFKTTPLLFGQLYTVHCLQGNNAVPLIYALLPNKTEETYSELFRKIKEFIPDANPETIMTDFESAVINVVHDVYPETRHRGCFFHLCQAIFRHIQSNGLKNRYEIDADFALKMKMLPALAFVPEEHVIQYFEVLCDENVFPEEAQPIIDYFEDTWIGRPNRRHRRPPRFPLSMWNCYQGTLQGQPKTNNSVEGWHRGFQELLSANHPSIWKFIDAIKRQQSLNELKIEQFLSGIEPPMGSRKYRDCAGRIGRIVQNFEYNVDIEGYVRSLAHNIGY